MAQGCVLSPISSPLASQIPKADPVDPVAQVLDLRRPRGHRFTLRCFLVSSSKRRKSSVSHARLHDVALYPVDKMHADLSVAGGRLWRSSLILSIVSCYLMWAITFLAQLHPLIVPKRSDLREQFLEH